MLAAPWDKVIEDGQTQHDGAPSSSHPTIFLRKKTAGQEKEREGARCCSL